MVKKFNQNFRVGQGGIVEANADVTLDSGSFLILCDATAGPVEVTLQRADGLGGKRYCIKKIDTSANAITISPVMSQTIDGEANLLLQQEEESVEIISDGENWLIVARNTPQSPIIASAQEVGAASNAIEFLPVNSVNVIKPAEPAVQIPIDVKFRIIRVRANVAVNTKDGATTLAFRVNSASVGPLAVGPGATGQFDSGALAVDVSPGDLINFLRDTAVSTAGVLDYIMIVEAIRIQ